MSGRKAAEQLPSFVGRLGAWRSRDEFDEDKGRSFAPRDELWALDPPGRGEDGVRAALCAALANSGRVSGRLAAEQLPSFVGPIEVRSDE